MADIQAIAEQVGRLSTLKFCRSTSLTLTWYGHAFSSPVGADVCLDTYYEPDTHSYIPQTTTIRPLTRAAKIDPRSPLFTWVHGGQRINDRKLTMVASSEGKLDAQLGGGADHG